MSAEATEVIAGIEYQIAVYRPFAAQLKELQAQNASLVFDYTNEKGNKEARSHIYKLRRTKTAVDEARKKEKEESLKRGRLIDGEAKDIISQIEAMIEVHQKPLDEIERKEQDRIGRMQAIVDSLIDVCQLNWLTFSIDEITKRLHEVEAVVVDAAFAEFMAPATTAKDKAVAVLKAALDAAQKRDAEAAELDRLRAEIRERAQKEREERIALLAAEKAKAEAEQRGKEMQEAAANRERELMAQAEQAKRAAIELQERAFKAVKETEERIKRETEEKAKAEAAEQAKRDADREHKSKCNREARDALIVELGIGVHVAELIVSAIVRGAVPRVSIRY